MSAIFQRFNGGRRAIDGFQFVELAKLFDAACNEARGHGLWLYEWDREFCDYCVDRLAWLAAHGSGEARR